MVNGTYGYIYVIEERGRCVGAGGECMFNDSESGG